MQPSRTGESRKCKQPPSLTDATCTYLKFKVHMMPYDVRKCATSVSVSFIYDIMEL